MTGWHHARAGVQAGPVSLEEIRRLVATGELGPDDLAWRPGLAEWLPVRSLPELQPHAGLPAAPAAPAAPTALAPSPHGAPRDAFPSPAGRSVMMPTRGAQLDLSLALRQGWDAFASNLLIGLFGMVVAGGAPFLLMTVDLLVGKGPILQWVGNIFLLPMLQGGFFYVAVLACQGARPGVEDFFRPLRRSYLPLLALTLLYYGAMAVFAVGVALVAAGFVQLEEMPVVPITVGLLVFLVVALYVAIRLYLTLPYVVEAEQGPLVALGSSWSATRGQVLRMFALMLVTAGIVLLGLLLLFVGVIPAVWLAACVAAAAYRQISGR